MPIKKQYTDKQLITFFVIFAILFVAISVFFCFAFKWYWVFAPAIVLLLIEFIARWVKFRKCPIPFHSWLSRREQPAEDISTVTDQLPVKPSVKIFIKDILLKDFLQCQIYKEFTIIPDEECFNDLNSQYQSARADENFGECLAMNDELNKLKLRKQFIDTNVAILKELYVKAAANGLRELYPDREFSIDSYIKDLDWVRKFEKNYARKMEETAQLIEDRFGGGENGKELTPDEQYYSYADRILAINQALQSNYSMETITVLLFARGEMMLSRHIEQLKKQKSGGTM